MARFLLLTLCLCLIALPVMAQDATPQPEQGFIIGWSAEPIFPAAVRFTVTLGRAFTNLASADLLIQQETGDAITLPINLQEAAVVTEPYSELAYIWTLPATNPPPLFHDITFKWRVISVSNEAALISDTFTFTDQRVQWLRDQSVGDGVKLTLADTDPLTQIQRSIKPVYDLLSTNTGKAPTFQILLNHLPVCIPNAANLPVAVGTVSQSEVPCSSSMAEAIFRVGDYDVVSSPSSKIEDIQTALAAYLTDKFYASLWIGKNVPAWFQSGLAQFYSPTPKTDYGPPLVNAARTNTLLPLTEMNRSPNTTQADVWAAQSYGMVVYIAAQIGVDGLFKLASNVQDAESFTLAYQSAVGQPLEALLPDLGRWIFTNAGLSAFSFTAYQAPTATPTATGTPTATYTSTATSTATITPTPTVTGVLSLTPRATQSPTKTPTHAPPTRTPRPPGSLNRATATLIPSSSVSQVAGNPRIIIFGAVVGLLVIAISAVVYRMFRGK